MEKILLIGIGLYLLTKQQFSRVKYYPVGISFTSITPYQLESNIKLRIENNSNIILSAKSFSGQLIYGGNIVGWGQVNEPVSILPFSAGTIDIRTTVTISGVVSTIINTGSGQKMILRGRIYFENFSIPVNTSIEI